MRQYGPSTQNRFDLVVSSLFLSFIHYILFPVRSQGVKIVGYEATSEQKDHLRQLVRHQTRSYKRMQDKKAQLTKATRELDRLPAWPPNSPDLNLIEVVWSWLVGDIASEGWPTTPEELISAAKRAWANVSVDSFRELCRSYRQRLLAIHSVNGDRHPNFA